MGQNCLCDKLMLIDKESIFSSFKRMFTKIENGSQFFFPQRSVQRPILIQSKCSLSPTSGLAFLKFELYPKFVVVVGYVKIIFNQKLLFFKWLKTIVWSSEVLAGKNIKIVNPDFVTEIRPWISLLHYHINLNYIWCILTWSFLKIFASTLLLN